MGIGADSQAMLRELCQKLPPGFSVCELGDQLIATKRINKPGRLWDRGPAEPFYRKLGCGEYVTIDGNGKATVLADLNLPLPDKLGPFDLVTNFGTTEHVFDQAQCWRTIHELTKAGGYIAFEQPSQGYEDHGLYNLHPGLIKDIAYANGYTFEHFETPDTPRGKLIRAVMRKPDDREFATPQQGKYRKKLKV